MHAKTFKRIAEKGPKIVYAVVVECFKFLYYSKIMVCFVVCLTLLFV